MKSTAKLLIWIVVSHLMSSPANAGVSFDLSTASTHILSPGDTVDIDVRIRSDGVPVFGLGAAVEGFDPTILSFTSGQAVSGYLFELCFPSAGCFGGLDNLAGGSLAANGTRIQFANSASLTGRSGTGANDSGVGGNTGVHARVTFTAVALGTTTVSVGTNAAIGNVIVYSGGATAPATANASLTIRVVPCTIESPPDLPVALWRLDEPETPLYDVAGCRTVEISAGSPSLAQPSPLVVGAGRSISSGPSGATLEAPFDSTMNTPTFSIEAWVSFDDGCYVGAGEAGLCRLVSASRPELNDGYVLAAVDTEADTTLAFILNAGGSPTNQRWLVGPAIIPGQWYHLVGTFDGSTQRLFVNGLENGSKDATFVTNGGSAFELLGSGEELSANTSLDEIAYYDYALNSAQVLAHYEAGIPRPCDWVGFYPPSTTTLGPRQNNSCEDWSGRDQTGREANGSNLAEADLSLANLLGVDLSGTDLSGADLTRTILVGAALSSANLNAAILFDSFLLGADLTGAELTGATLDLARYDEHTLFPSGGTIYSYPHGLPNGIAPWDAGMRPVPEPTGLAPALLGTSLLIAIGRARSSNRP